MRNLRSHPDRVFLAFRRFKSGRVEGEIQLSVAWKEISLYFVEMYKERILKYLCSI